MSKPKEPKAPIEPKPEDYPKKDIIYSTWYLDINYTYRFMGGAYQKLYKIIDNFEDLDFSAQKEIIIELEEDKNLKKISYYDLTALTDFKVKKVKILYSVNSSRSKNYNDNTTLSITFSGAQLLSQKTITYEQALKRYEKQYPIYQKKLNEYYVKMKKYEAYLQKLVTLKTHELEQIQELPIWDKK